MTKKHFIALADAIRIGNRFAGLETFSQEAINQLADFCQSQNSDFKRDRWLEYIAGKCGKSGGKVGRK